MSFRVDAAIAQLFGSAVRVKILGFLAGSTAPATGYAVAKAIGVRPSKVYAQLRLLAGGGFVRVASPADAPKAYALSDEDLRSLMSKRVRITTSQDWFSPTQVRKRERAFREVSRIRVRLPPSSPRPEAVPNRGEFERPSEKDRAIARIRRSRSQTARSDRR